MALANVMEKVFIWFGKNISPAFVSASIAAAKGVFRPIFTMSDKKQDRDSRVYAALREGLTEGIAIPVYLGSGALAKAISKKVARPKNMAKDLFADIINTKQKFDVKKLVGTAFSEADVSTVAKNFHKMNGTLGMLGVFASALVVIPALCSATIKPLMKYVQPKDSKTTKDIATVKGKPVITRYDYLFTNNSYYKLNHFPKVSSGLKVGNV